MRVSVVSFCFYFPSVLCVGSSLQIDRKQLSKASLTSSALSVLPRTGCMKGRACFQVKFLEDFQTCGILSFEKSGGNYVEGPACLL